MKLLRSIGHRCACLGWPSDLFGLDRRVTVTYRGTVGLRPKKRVMRFKAFILVFFDRNSSDARHCCRQKQRIENIRERSRLAADG
jgi:hypothetical protein